MIKRDLAIELSVIIPVGDRHSDPAVLLADYQAGLAALGKRYEIIFVLDGAQSDFASRLRPLVAEMPRVHLACVEEAGHGWNENFVRRQLDLLEAFLEGRPLPDAGSATDAA